MILEVFGPTGVGKTTLTRALAMKLSEAGYPVMPMISARRTDHLCSVGTPPNLIPFATTVHRTGISMILVEMVSAFVTGYAGEHVAADLVRAFPPRGLIWHLRLYRYLRALSDLWAIVGGVPGIAIFDQGFVQSLCSLFLLCQQPRLESLRRGLDLIPAADVLICARAPQDIIRARLQRRRLRQSVIERLLELNVSLCLRQGPVIEALLQLLELRGREPIVVECIDQISVSEASARIMQIVLSHASLTRDDALDEKGSARPSAMHERATLRAFVRKC